METLRVFSRTARKNNESLKREAKAMSDAANCVYCKIINKELPAFVLYENDCFLVILDKFPAAPGHALIISKQHAADIFELDAETAARVFPLAQKIAQALKDALDCTGVNIVQNNGARAGQSVFHFHTHVIPRYENDTAGLQLNSKDASLEELEEVCKKITGDI